MQYHVNIIINYGTLKKLGICYLCCLRKGLVRKGGCHCCFERDFSHVKKVDNEFCFYKFINLFSLFTLIDSFKNLFHQGKIHKIKMAYQDVTENISQIYPLPPPLLQNTVLRGIKVLRGILFSACHSFCQSFYSITLIAFVQIYTTP